MYKGGLLFCFMMISLSLFAQDAKWKRWELEADTLMNRQEYDQAIKHYTKAIKSSKLKDKSAYTPVYKRAVCYYSIGQYNAALHDLETFLTENPDIYQAYLLKAFIYRENNDTENQLEALDQALAINPGDPDLIKWRSGIYLEKGEYEKVKNDLLYVKSIQDDPEVEMYLGFAYYSLEQSDSAFMALNMAIQMDPTFVPAYLYGGSFSLQDSNYDLALKYLDVALKLSPGNTSAQFYKGVALLELDREKEGCRYLARAFYAREDDAGGYLKERCYTLIK